MNRLVLIAAVHTDEIDDAVKMSMADDGLYCVRGVPFVAADGSPDGERQEGAGMKLLRHSD